MDPNDEIPVHTTPQHTHTAIPPVTQTREGDVNNSNPGSVATTPARSTLSNNTGYTGSIPSITMTPNDELPVHTTPQHTHTAIPAVTQTQEGDVMSTHPGSATTTPARSTLSKRGNQHTHLFEVFDLYNNDLSIQTPLRPHPDVIVRPSPEITSPSKNMKEAGFTLLSMKTPRHASFMRDLSKERSKRQKVLHDPVNLLSFLRDPYINSIKSNSVSSSEEDKLFSVGQHFKSAYAQWWPHGRCVALKPFEDALDLKRKMDSAPYPLSLLHYRLLVEDVMLLQPGESILLMMSQDHHLLKEPSTSNIWQSIFLKSWEIEPLQHVLMQRVNYYAINVEVLTNATLRNFEDNNYTESEVRQLCTKWGGAGVVLGFPSGKQHLFKFYDILAYPKGIIFMGRGERQR